MFSLATPALAGSQHLGDRVLRRGMSGHDVRILQDFLTRLGFSTPVGGDFGPITDGNVRRFERTQHMRADGVVSRRVARALRLAVASDSHPSVQQNPGSSSGGAGVNANQTLVGSTSTNTTPGAKARLNSDGTAAAPASAPDVIRRVIAAGNKIAFTPYIYGGGHGDWNDSGYDCSGSVSFALHGGGLISSPETSGDLESYGSAGRGRWITIYANSGHVYMYVAGLRFDTSSHGTNESRWTNEPRSGDGYTVRHPTGW
jgi:peptidoglycan hydrolase-like protein with peptidoglycan-binding domain